MQRLQGIYCTDGIARNNTCLSISALDDMIWMGSDGGRPTNMSHDIHRFIGWSVVNGLYMSHELSYVVGNTYIPESKDENKELQERRLAFFYKYMGEVIQNYKIAFIEELNKLKLYCIDGKGRWLYNGIVLYGYVDILYNAFPELKEHIDGDGLIRLEHLLEAFNYCGQGVFKSKHNQLSVILHSFFRRSYSIYNNYNFGFLDKLFEVYNNGNHSVKVRLDTNLIGFAPSWRQSHEYEFWYGPKYNDDIESIPKGLTRYESDEIDKVYINIKSTEFIWQKKDDGKLYQFEMEEVTDVEAPTLEKDTYGCRYLHALYDFDHKEFNHFDGAIRCYDFEKMIERIDTPMNQMGHQAEYTKIFRIDGGISLDLWKSLITQYLCSNHSVYDYFGIPRPFPKPQKEQSRGNTLKDYVPYQIDKGDGIRLFISYHDTKVFETNRCFCNYDSIELKDEIHYAIDFSTLEVAKAFWKVGAEIEMPTGVKVVLVEDYSHTIPQIFHSKTDCQEDLNKTLEGIRLLINQHIKNGDDEIYSFSLGWNIEAHSVSISFMGHVFDIYCWLNSFESIPIKHEELKIWLEKQNDYIHKNGKDSSSPLEANHIQNDGILYFQHRHVLKDVRMSDMKMDPQVGMTAKIETEDKVLGDLLNKGEICFTPLFVVSDATDGKTRESYFKSPYSGIFHETTYILDNIQLISFVWTTKPKIINISEYKAI